MEYFLLRSLAISALAEDLAYGDKTTDALFADPIPAVGIFLAKEEMVLAGTEMMKAVFQQLDPTVQFEMERAEGCLVQKGETLFRLFADGRILLKGERTALNFLQRLSGIATLTRRFVEQVKGTSSQIVDTRKTTPGLRALEKEAVRAGGGRNHRLHLGEMVLIKDNHVALAGGMAQAISRSLPPSPSTKIEVEVTTLSEVETAVQYPVDLIMLDNMTLPEIHQAVSCIRRKSNACIEVSGGVRMENVAEIAASGVDFISIGALTHSAPAMDISMEITPAACFKSDRLRI